MKENQSSIEADFDAHRPKTPDVRPVPQKPEIQNPRGPQVKPDIPNEPVMPSTSDPTGPEIQPGKTKEPEIPAPSPDEPHE